MVVVPKSHQVTNQPELKRKAKIVNYWEDIRLLLWVFSPCKWLPVCLYLLFVYKVHVQNSQVQSFHIQSPLAELCPQAEMNFIGSAGRVKGVNENCLEDSARAPPLRKIVMWQHREHLKRQKKEDRRAATLAHTHRELRVRPWETLRFWFYAEV